MSSLEKSVQSMLDDPAVPLLDVFAKMLGDYIGDAILDVNYVWPTPEQHQRAAKIRAEIAKAEHETLYGDGSAEPKGILYAKGAKRR